ncbi:MAG: hypothetical protein ACREAC_13205, partial [Blastocatellia bacterium]
HRLWRELLLLTSLRDPDRHERDIYSAVDHLSLWLTCEAREFRRAKFCSFAVDGGTGSRR